MSDNWKSILAGAAAGLVNGFLGGGGGMVLVPAFTGWLKLDQKKALATSVAVIAPVCLLSAIIYFFRGELDLMAALPYLVGGLIGGVAGSKLFQKMSPLLLKRLFGILILYGGVRSFF